MKFLIETIITVTVFAFLFWLASLHTKSDKNMRSDDYIKEKMQKCNSMFPNECHCACRCLGNEFCDDADKKIKELIAQNNRLNLANSELHRRRSAEKREMSALKFDAKFAKRKLEKVEEYCLCYYQNKDLQGIFDAILNIVR